jgi:hypothetical protein
MQGLIEQGYGDYDLEFVCDEICDYGCHMDERSLDLDEGYKIEIDDSYHRIAVHGG